MGQTTRDHQRVDSGTTSLGRGYQQETTRQAINTRGGVEVDLGRQLQFPQEICSTTLRPDVVLWSAAVKAAILIELTVPWEEGLEAAYERN